MPNPQIDLSAGMVQQQPPPVDFSSGLVTQHEAGAIRRFFTRALGVPDDVFDHPNKWLNPFSKEYNSLEHKAEVQQELPPPGLNAQGEPDPHMPGAQTVQDIKSGNYAGALGDVIPPAIQLAGVASGFGRSAPVELPNVYEGPMPAEIPAGKPQAGPGIINRTLTAVANAGPKDVVGLASPRLAHLQNIAETMASLTAKAPVGERPVYGNVSNAEARGPYQPYQGDLTVIPEIQPKAPVQRNAPIRGESQDLQTFTQSTPTDIAANAERMAANLAARRQLAPASAGQNPVPQEVATALEKSSGELTRLPSQSTLSGESALRQILTGQDNANLMRIAKSRGLSTTREAQLKPGVADRLLVNKIIDDFTPEQLDEIEAKFAETQRFKHNFGDVGPEAWKSLSMQTFFPDVKLPAAMAKRVNAAIQAAAPQAESAPNFAYRVRDAGETGIMPRGSHAQATLDPAQATNQDFIQGRASAQNAPQEVVRVDLNKLDPKDYSIVKQNGQQWVKFNKAVPESFIEKMPTAEKAMAQAAAVGATMPQELAPQLATDANMEQLLQQSLRRQLLKKAGLK